MNKPNAILTNIQQNIAATQANRERLRLVSQAISGGQFDKTPVTGEQHGLNNPFSRSEMMANAMDATFELMQQRVIGDLHGAMNHLDAVARFKTASAQADFAASHPAPVTDKPNPTGDVIDVEAKDISNPTPST